MSATEKKSAFNYFVFFFLLSLLFLLLDKFNQLSWLKGFAAGFVNPVRVSVYSFYKELKLSGKSDKGAQILEEKLEQLEIEAGVLKSQISELEQENQSMRRLLGAPFPASLQFLPVKIIGEKAGEIFINKGRKDGILKGQAVVFGKSYVGRILRLDDETGRVETLYHKELDLPVRVAGTAISGKLRLFNGQIIIDEVERNKDLSVGNILVISGDEVSPAGIVVGELKRIIDEPTAFFQRAQVKPMVEPGELVDVFVVSNQ